MQTQKSPALQALNLILLLVVCFGVAAIGSVWTSLSVDDWYADLRKPAWNPPNWLFAPVWSALYLGMAVAAWMVWRRAGWAEAKWFHLLFGLQLILNATWSGLFFGLRSPGAALIELAFLWLAIVATIVASACASWWAVALLVPYLGWVSFAGILNWSIWRLNA